MNTMNEIKVTCPSCGKQFVANIDGELPVTKAQKRMQALKEAGVDVSGLFAMQTGNIARLDDGVISVVPDDDPIFQAIMDGGVIPDRRLFRRWVMAQMFHMLSSGDFTQKLRNKGYCYQWKTIENELKTQAKLFRDDVENYNERNKWFNNRTVVYCCRQYLTYLEKRIAYLIKHHQKRCKGVPYIRIAGTNVFVDDLEEKVIYPVCLAIDKMAMCDDNNALEVYRAYLEFKKVFVKLPFNTSMVSTIFIDAYKGVGAYYTMKNMILFHGCVFQSESGNKMSTSQSMEYLHEKNQEYASIAEGWRLFGLMKKLINDNEIDIEAKMAEWRKQ